MNKVIELTQSQINEYENDASMFIFPIINNTLRELAKDTENHNKFIQKFSPLQKGDNAYINELCLFEYRYSESTCLDNYLGEILDVRVVRVQDICAFDFFGYCSFEESNGVGGFNILYNINEDEYDEGSICYFYGEYYDKQMQEQNIKKTYEDNDYVFLVEVGRG